MKDFVFRYLGIVSDYFVWLAQAEEKEVKKKSISMVPSAAETQGAFHHRDTHNGRYGDFLFKNYFKRY